MKLPTFKPKQGVHIETDPKGTAKPIAHGDDTAVIEELIMQLEVHLQLPDFSLHISILLSIPVSQYAAQPVSFTHVSSEMMHFDQYDKH